MGALSEKAQAEVEEHYLACESCRQKVAASDSYTAAMKQAATRLRRAERKPKREVPRTANGTK
jgi:anti-sigma factor RsiW